MKLLFIVVAAVLAGTAQASCPGACSGHGHCGLYDLCSCYPNWAGLDCSGRVCPSTKAWVDVALADDNAHNYATCGNKGACDGKSGTCKCYDSFEGKGCRRLTCNNGCSGHGTCETIEELANYEHCAFDSGTQGRVTTCVHSSIANYAADSLTYTGWDRQKIQGCKCDPGWEGNDCSGRICPRGNDPLRHRDATDDHTQLSHTFRVVIDSPTLGTTEANGMGTPAFVLAFKDTYGEKWFTRPISLNSNGADAFLNSLATAPIKNTLEANVYAALLELPNGAITGTLADPITGLDTAASALSVTVTTDADTATIDIQLNSPHNAGNLVNRLECHHAGCSAASTATSAVPGGCSPKYHGTGGTCVVTDQVVGDKNEDTCSSRGSCDGGSGLCQCHDGYTDEDCSMQTTLI